MRDRLRLILVGFAACLVGAGASAMESPAQRRGPPGVSIATATQAPGTDLARWCTGIRAIAGGAGVDRCQSLKLWIGNGRSVKGTPLWLTDVVPAAGAQAPLRVLVLGGIHADEEASVALVMDWIVRARRAAAARPVHWRLVPLVNPDGFFRAARTRVNVNGVDLNRNFATHQWSKEAQKYWIQATRRDPRRYPGPAALSEPESRWVHEQIATFRPNLIVSVHAPYGVLDFDGPPPPPTRLGNLMLDQVGIYPGSLGNYGGIVLGVPVVTIELKHSTRVTAADASAMWSDLEQWIGNRLLNAGGTTRLGATRADPPATN
jgi:murein peptide amidase A